MFLCIAQREKVDKVTSLQPNSLALPHKHVPHLTFASYNAINSHLFFLLSQLTFVSHMCISNSTGYSSPQLSAEIPISPPPSYESVMKEVNWDRHEALSLHSSSSVMMSFPNVSAVDVVVRRLENRFYLAAALWLMKKIPFSLSSSISMASGLCRALAYDRINYLLVWTRRITRFKRRFTQIYWSRTSIKRRTGATTICA